MQKRKTLIENQEKLERKYIIVIMELENIVKCERERDRAIELFKEKLEIRREDKVKLVKEMGFNR